VCVDAAQSAESATTRAQTPPVGQFDGSGIPDHHVLNVPPAVREHADLSANVVADLAQLSGELVAHQAIGGQAPLEKSVQLFDLAGLEAAGIAENLDGGLSGLGCGQKARAFCAGLRNPASGA